MKKHHIANEKPMTREEAENLYRKYIYLALNSQTKRKDRDLFDIYYERAEYYLFIMNKLAEPCLDRHNMVSLDRHDMVISNGKIKICKNSKSQKHQYPIQPPLIRRG
jgi:hypothetical protein